MILRLRATDASTIVIHHTTKEAYKSEGEIIWSGSSNAITIYDRTCGIKRSLTDSFELVTGYKQGRSGDGWNDALDEIIFNVGDSGLVTVDEQLLVKTELEGFHCWLLGNIGIGLRGKLQELNRRLGLGMGRNLTLKELWAMSQWRWIIFDDDFNWTSFTNYIRTGQLPSANGDNERVF